MDRLNAIILMDAPEDLNERLKFEAECIYLHVMTELTLTWQFFKPELYPGNQILIKVSFTSLFPIDADCVKTAITLEMPTNPYNHACHAGMVARRDLFPINKPGRCWQLPDSFYVRLILDFRRYNKGSPIICLVLNNRLKQAVFPGFPIDTYTPYKRSLCMRTIPKREFVSGYLYLIYSAKFQSLQPRDSTEAAE